MRTITTKPDNGQADGQTNDTTDIYIKYRKYGDWSLNQFEDQSFVSFLS